MVETNMMWEIGDVCGDGHGKYENILIAVGHPEGTNAIKQLGAAEEKLKTDYDIYLETWFQDYDDWLLPPEEVKKLGKLHVEYDEYEVDYEGQLSVPDAKAYFDIWRQLITSVDPQLTIRQISLPIFCGKCTGYGLFEGGA